MRLSSLLIGLVLFSACSPLAHRKCIRQTDQVRWHYFSIQLEDGTPQVHGVSILDLKVGKRQIWFSKYPHWTRQWTDTGQGYLEDQTGRRVKKEDVLFHYDTEDLQNVIKEANRIPDKDGSI